MNDSKQIISINNIQNRIFTIRGVQVMIDRDLAEIYGVETRRLNEQVKRNIDRFPEPFMYQMTKEEMENWKSQIAISNKVKMGLRKPPLAFTEQGVSMISAILKSETAVKVSIQIINAFVKMRKFIINNDSLNYRLYNLEQKQTAINIKQLDTDNKIEAILNAIETKEIKPRQGIFYDGQVFDAYIFIADLIKSAKTSILLIDNFVDETVLQLFTKRNKNVSVCIYTKNISKVLKQDLNKHNTQHPKIELKQFAKAHDRFLIIDKNTVYHIGASLKDLGKKWFAFSRMSASSISIISKLKEEDLI